MASPRVAFCEFCDDIRLEAGNKFSIMGIYGTEMHFAVPAPALLVKWGIFFWLITDIGDIPQKINVKVLIPPDRQEVFSTDIPIAPAEHTEGATKLRWRTPIMMPMINLTAEGYIEVIVETELGSMRAGRIFVKFPEVASPVITDNSPPS